MEEKNFSKTLSQVEPQRWTVGVVSAASHWIVDVSTPAKYWMKKAVQAARHGAAVLFNIEQTKEALALVRDDYAKGAKLDSGYHAVAALLAAAGGVVKAVTIGAVQVARYAPEAASLVASSMPGSPLKIASVAWKVGGAEVAALRELRAGQGVKAGDDAVLGLGHMAASLGATAIGRAAALLATALVPGVGPWVGIAAGLAFSLGCEKALTSVSNKLSARRAATEQLVAPTQVRLPGLH